jgi:GNAT superfamily N-acetyltransferase
MSAPEESIANTLEGNTCGSSNLSVDSAASESAGGSVSLASTNLFFSPLQQGDYERCKRVLNAARHPGYVGREMFWRCATTGGATVAVLEGKDVGVSLVAGKKLLVLSVIQSAQRCGIGRRLLAHARPAWVSAIQSRVPWFEARGYVCVGAPKVGMNGKHAVQLMSRDEDSSSSEFPELRSPSQQIVEKQTKVTARDLPALPPDPMRHVIDCALKLMIADVESIDVHELDGQSSFRLVNYMRALAPLDAARRESKEEEQQRAAQMTNQELIDAIMELRKRHDAGR